MPQVMSLWPPSPSKVSSRTSLAVELERSELTRPDSLIRDWSCVIGIEGVRCLTRRKNTLNKKEEISGIHSHLFLDCSVSLIVREERNAKLVEKRFHPPILPATRASVSHTLTLLEYNKGCSRTFWGNNAIRDILTCKHAPLSLLTITQAAETEMFSGVTSLLKTHRFIVGLLKLLCHKSL